MAPVFRSSEWITLGYFAYLALTAMLTGVSAERRCRVLSTILFAVATTVALALQTGEVAAVARDWLPMANLIIGYWLPAQLVTRINPDLEASLMRLDRRLFGVAGLQSFGERAPRLLIEYLEAAYLLCYPIVPAGLAWLAFAGLRAQAGEYWRA